MLQIADGVPKVLNVAEDAPAAWLRTLEHAYPLGVSLDWVS